MNIKQTQKGFTLIELMIVIAIIGILAAVALPAYSDYTNRAKMSEVILAASGCRTEVTEIVQTGSVMPGTPGCAKTGGVSKYVTSVAVSGAGVVSVVVPATLVAGTVTLTPFDNTTTAVVYDASATPVWSADIASWRCAATPAALQKLLPSSCQS